MNLVISNGAIAIVDEDDFERARRYHWHNGGTYIRAWDGLSGRKIYLHRFIAQATDGQVVDHIDGNKFNNRRANLRICTQQQNTFNQRGSTNNSSGFKGVARRPDTGRWRARIMLNRKEITLGCFDNAIDAAHAYDAAAMRYFGRFAYLNFPNSWPEESTPTKERVA